VVAGGKYRIDRVLGIGGMGMVVAATHLHLGQIVAIKFMLPAALKDKESVERFLLEARSAAALKSEHVARVLDVGTLETGAPYIVMEYLEGLTLDAFLEQGNQLSVAEAVEYTIQVCEAVAEAHTRGIIHRDLKPTNLFLTRTADKRALVKVIDFGLSKSIGANSRKITKDFTVMGTPTYMSPEQLRSTSNVDTRTDIWALGVVLYELMSGQVPFEAESIAEVCALVLGSPPRPIEQAVRDVPPELSAVITRCLQKEPDDRFASVAELAEALNPFVPVGTTSAGERIRRVQSQSEMPPSLRSSQNLAIGPLRPTQGSWGTDALLLELQPKTNLRVWIGITAAVALLAIVVLVFGLRSRHDSEVQALTVAPPAATVLGAAGAPPAPSPSADPAPAPSDAASASGSPAPSAPGPASSPAASVAVARPHPRAITPGSPTRPRSTRPSAPNRDKMLENR
jgi:serine/threonine-protein kinase